MKHFIFTLIALMGAIVISGAQNNSEKKSKSSWEVSQTVELPANVKIFTGVTKSGNPKAWVELPDIGKVTVSPTNAEKYKAGEIKLELVKWKDKDKIKYTIRQLGGRGSKQVSDVDLSKLF